MSVDRTELPFVSTILVVRNEQAAVVRDEHDSVPDPADPTKRRAPSGETTSSTVSAEMGEVSGIRPIYARIVAFFNGPQSLPATLALAVLYSLPY